MWQQTTAITAGASGLAGIGAVQLMDRAIDLSGHDHQTWYYRGARVPEHALGVLSGLALAVGAASYVDGSRPTGESQLGAGAALGAASIGVVAYRDARGAVVDPTPVAGRLHFALHDIAKNAVDRYHLIGLDPSLAPRRGLASLSLMGWLDRISQWQGHGHLIDRLADFVPVKRV
jgi:hypothetical protein